jgi:hypothetical protein
MKSLKRRVKNNPTALFYYLCKFAIDKMGQWMYTLTHKSFKGMKLCQT